MPRTLFDRLVAGLFLAAALLPVSQLPAQNLTIPDGTTYSSGQTQTIGATNTIITGGNVVVASGANITFQAGTTWVKFEPGFHAQTGSAFTALIAPDTVAPTPVTGLASSNLTATSVTVSWGAAYDAFGVTAYQVFANGVSKGTFASLGTNLTGLTANTSYAITVQARDAAGNWSAASAALNVTTLTVPQQDTGNATIKLNVHIP